MRVALPAGSWSPSATAAAGADVGGVAIRALPQSCAEEPLGAGGALLTFALRFPAGFAWARGGTLPGIFLLEDDGQVRVRVGFGWRAGGKCHFYCTTDGVPGDIEELSRAYFVAGRWHFLTVRLEESGALTAWSGESAVASGRVALAEGATAGLLLTAFYGGATEDWAAPVDAYLDLGGFSLWSLCEAGDAD